VPCPKLWVLEQHRVDLRMQTIPCLPFGGDLQLWKMRGQRGFPLGQFLIAAIEPQAQRKAHRATDIEAGHRIVGQGIGPVAMVVVPIHVVKETAYMLAQRIIDDDERLAAATAMGFRLVEHEADATVIDGVFPPGRFREKAGEIGFIGTVEDAAGHIGQALVGQDDEPGQIVLKMPKLALVVKHVAEDLRVFGHHRSRLNNRQFHRTPPYPGQGTQLSPRVTWGSRQGKSQLSSNYKLGH